MSAENQIHDITSARTVVQTYEVLPNIFVLGSLSAGVTVYRQQVRAHNLVSGLKCLANANEFHLRSIAIVGGGIGGLTVAAALLAIDPNVHVTVFEKRWDLCPLQQGCDTRWLHPKIYDWPALGSAEPESDLPVLKWRKGRASDVAARILNGFAIYCEQSETPSGSSGERQHRIEVFLGLSHLSIDGATRRIEWMGHLAERQGRHFRSVRPAGDTRSFDGIILAVGFGLEQGYNPDQIHSPGSYWRSDTLGQPALAGTKTSYIVSGYGDGAIVDLCRLTIERFGQDTILEELFKKDLEQLEEGMRKIVPLVTHDAGRDLKSVLETSGNGLLTLINAAAEQLTYRVRKDTTVILHAKGVGNAPRSINKVFAPGSSTANRLLLYLLYRAGAFLVRFSELGSVKREFSISTAGIVQRHGTAAKESVLDLFVEPDTLHSNLDGMKQRNDQSTDRLFPLGSFRPIPEGA
ncbi:NAD(P)-binding protein [Acidisoma sp. 7E03]